MSVTLADIWKDMGTDERLAVFLDSHKGADPSTLHPRYLDALENVRWYVIEGNPLPPDDFR